MSTHGSLPSWLPPPPTHNKSLSTSTSGHQPSLSNASSGSGNSVNRSGSRQNFLQDIYDKHGSQSQPLSQPNRGTSYDPSPDQRRGAQFRDKLRPQISNPSVRPGQSRDRERSDSPYNDRLGDHSGRGSRNTNNSYDVYSPPPRISDFRSPRGYSDGGSQSRDRDYYSRR